MKHNQVTLYVPEMEPEMEPNWTFGFLLNEGKKEAAILLNYANALNVSWKIGTNGFI